jgi:hypothetical protein
MLSNEIFSTEANGPLTPSVQNKGGGEVTGSILL